MLLNLVLFMREAEVFVNFFIVVFKDVVILILDIQIMDTSFPFSLTCG